MPGPSDQRTPSGRRIIPASGAPPYSPLTPTPAQRPSDSAGETSRTVSSGGSPARRFRRSIIAQSQSIPLEEPSEFGEETTLVEADDTIVPAVELEHLLTHATVYFLSKSTKFSTDSTKAGFVAAKFRGKSLDWLTSKLKDFPNYLNNWTTFKKDLRTAFLPSEDTARQNAELSLHALRQKGSAQQYALEFDKLMVVLRYDDATKIVAFRAGLKPEVKKQMTTMKSSTRCDRSNAAGEAKGPPELTKIPINIEAGFHSWKPLKFRYSQQDLSIIRNWLNANLELGIIEESSAMNRASLLLIPREHDLLRVVGDFTSLNKGWCNAPAYWQRFISSVLRGLLGLCCFAYMDDVIIYSDDVKAHFIHERQVLGEDLLRRQIGVSPIQAPTMRMTRAFLLLREEPTPASEPRIGSFENYRSAVLSYLELEVLGGPETGTEKSGAERRRCRASPCYSTWSSRDWYGEVWRREKEVQSFDYRSAVLFHFELEVLGGPETGTG
ncbi:hypothetical protein MY10362_001711 [Beauveria mimosiformis]